MSDREKIIKLLHDALVLTKAQPEIVRCKDCVYALLKADVKQGHIVCTKPFTETWQAIKPYDWFCANGERLESNCSRTPNS